jgi:Peptidase inhibitor family I36
VKKHVLVVLAGATVALALGMGSAAAAPARPGWLPGGGAPCVDGDGGLCLYYNANGTGSRVETFGDISCYDNCGGTNYVFNDNTVGTNGYGDQVRNAVHYVYNNDDSSGYSIFVSPNYGGYADQVCPDGVTYCDFVDDAPGYGGENIGDDNTWDEGWRGNLGFTLNNNASQEYVNN